MQIKWTMIFGFLLILVSCADVVSPTPSPTRTITRIVETVASPTQSTIATHTAVPTVTPVLIATETAVATPTAVQMTAEEDVLNHLETLQTKYEQLLNNHEGWLYVRRTENMPTALRGDVAVNFYGLADTWVWEHWYEINAGTVKRQIIHVSDESGGIWQRQLIADGWTVLVLPVDTLEDRVQRLDLPTIRANTLLGPYRMIQLLQQAALSDVTGWEENDLYHVTFSEVYDTPIETVGVEMLVIASRSHLIFDSNRGVKLQDSHELQLSTEEWRQLQESNITQFDLFEQLPDNATYTLQAGIDLLAAER